MSPRRDGRSLALGVVALLIAACGGGDGGQTLASSSLVPAGPSAATTGAAARTRADVQAALAALGLQVAEPRVPFLPPESPLLAAAPRIVLQVVLPDDPAHGFVSIYEFTAEDAAVAAGREQASYVSSGPGRVQFPLDARFALRQLDSTVIFFAWSPANSPDPRTPTIQQTLETLGSAIPIPR